MNLLGRLLSHLVIGMGYLLLACWALYAAGATLTMCHDGGHRWPSEKIARVSMGNVVQALELYGAREGELPMALAALLEPSTSAGFPYIDRIDDDPWGNPYIYERVAPDRGRLTCRGEDGMPETEDDLAFEVALDSRDGKHGAQRTCR